MEEMHLTCPFFVSQWWQKVKTLKKYTYITLNEAIIPLSRISILIFLL